MFNLEVHARTAHTRARRTTRIAMICKEPTSDQNLGRDHMRAGNLVDNLASTVGADKAYIHTVPRTTSNYTYMHPISGTPGTRDMGERRSHAMSQEHLTSLDRILGAPSSKVPDGYLLTYTKPMRYSTPITLSNPMTGFPSLSFASGPLRYCLATVAATERGPPDRRVTE